MTPEEFSRLFLTLKSEVFHYARNRRLSAQQADDVVAETFEVVWRRRDQVPQGPRDRTAWIMGVARNKVRQEIADTVRRRHDRRFLTDDEADHLRASDDVPRQVIRTHLGKETLQRLRDEDLELFYLAYIAGASPHDAAKTLMISTTAYTTRLSRLRSRLEAIHLDVAN